MATMVREVYDAFRDEKAGRAAEVLATPPDAVSRDMADLKSDVAGLKIDMATVKTDILDVKSELKLLRWAVGVNTALSVAILVKLLFA